MPAGTAMFVQFPHPGGEHRPRSETMPWNTGKHRRKFLRGPGEFVDADDRRASAELVFWGEWEPPSRIEHRWPREGRKPRALHRPYWHRGTAARARQNTDPWVFGEQMLYSNCRQLVGRQRRATSMQDLPVGSVICFGSTINSRFCVDTVFVVASSVRWTPAEADELDVDDAFKICTGDSIVASGNDAHADLTLYRGASFDNPVHGMYSFVPARAATDPDYLPFPRPVIEREELINPAARQPVRGSTRPLPLPHVRKAWEDVRQQVLAADLVLAVHLETPPEGEPQA